MRNVTLLATGTATPSRQSGVFDLGDLFRFAIQVTISGADVAGSLKLQASLDNTTWVDVANSTQAITSSADHMWDVNDAGYRYVRVDWTYTSGTGNITITLHVKDPIIAGG